MVEASQVEWRGRVHEAGATKMPWIFLEYPWMVRGLHARWNFLVLRVAAAVGCC